MRRRAFAVGGPGCDFQSEVVQHAAGTLTTGWVPTPNRRRFTLQLRRALHI